MLKFIYCRIVLLVYYIWWSEILFKITFAAQSLSDGRSADSRRGGGRKLWTIAVRLRHWGYDQRTARTNKITDHKLSHARPRPGAVAGDSSQVHIRPESETGTGCVIPLPSWLLLLLLRLSLLSVKILLDLREFFPNACADKSRKLAGKNRHGPMFAVSLES